MAKRIRSSAPVYPRKLGPVHSGATKSVEFNSRFRPCSATTHRPPSSLEGDIAQFVEKTTRDQRNDVPVEDTEMRPGIQQGQKGDLGSLWPEFHIDPWLRFLEAWKGIKVLSRADRKSVVLTW